MTRSSDGSLTALDWMGALVAALATLSLVGFALLGRSFEAMFSDFGAFESLPLWTRLVVQPWLPPLLALLPAALLAFGVLSRRSLGQRRLALVAAFAAGLLLIGLCVAGVYWPIFEMAGQIQ